MSNVRLSLEQQVSTHYCEPPGAAGPMTSSVRQFGFTTLATHAFAGRIELKSRSSLGCISQTQRSTLSAFTRVFTHYGDALQIPIFASRPAIAGRGTARSAVGGAQYTKFFSTTEKRRVSRPLHRASARSPSPVFTGGWGHPNRDCILATAPLQRVAADACLWRRALGLNSNSIRTFTQRTGSGTNLPQRFGTACFGAAC
jgi:hypothetical protein